LLTPLGLAGKKCVPVFLGLAQKCHEETYISTSSTPSFELLLPFTTSCVWARSNAAFQNPPERAVYCTEIGEDGKVPKLVFSTDYFKSSKTTVTLGGGDQGEIITGAVVGLGVVERFMVVAAAAPSAAAGAELFVSIDGQTFRRGRFPVGVGIKENAHTILPSAPHALFVDLASSVRNPTGSHPSFTGTLWVSDNTGSRFLPILEHTNRDLNTGKVDFERVDIGKGGGVYEGILVANVVQNWKDVEDGTTRFKDVVTRWSWDDGATWSSLKGPLQDSEGNTYKCDALSDPCDLHLHSSISGETTFGSPAPGVLLGVGSVGKKLLPLPECDTFLSVDGGASWTAVGKGEWEYVVGDIGSLIVMAREGKIKWSGDFGKTFFDMEPKTLPAGKSFGIERVITMPDSSSMQFVILAYSHNGAGREGPMEWHSIHLDMSNVFSKKCENGDLQLFKPRDYVGGSDCILGQELGWYRRKPEAECYVGEQGKDVRAEGKKCPCSAEDYSCDIYFERVSNDARARLNCTLKAWPNNRDPDMPRDCKPGDKYPSRSGYVKKPGDACVLGVMWDLPVERVCGSDTGGGSGGGDPIAPPAPNPDPGNGTTILDPPSSIKVSAQITSLGDADVSLVLYFKRSTVVLIKTRSGDLWWSGDEGGKWVKVLEELGKIEIVIMSDVVEKRAYFMTSKGETWYTEDRLQGYATDKDKTGSLKKMILPDGFEYNHLGIPVFDFHPTETEWLVAVVQPVGKCPGRECHTAAYTSIDHGKTWSSQAWDTWVRKCLWAQDVNFTASALTPDSVYCSGWKIKDGKFGGQETLESGLVSPADNPVEFAEYANAGTKRALFERVSDWYVVSGFLMIALVGFLACSRRG